MDVFDPSVAPGVCTPSWGGLSAREGITLLRALAGLRIVAIDFNTVSPPHDVADMAAHLCAHMAMEAALVLCRDGEGGVSATKLAVRSFGSICRLYTVHARPSSNLYGLTDTFSAS